MVVHEGKYLPCMALHRLSSRVCVVLRRYVCAVCTFRGVRKPKTLACAACFTPLPFQYKNAKNNSGSAAADTKRQGDSRKAMRRAVVQALARTSSKMEAGAGASKIGGGSAGARTRLRERGTGVGGGGAGGGSLEAPLHPAVTVQVKLKPNEYVRWMMHQHFARGDPLSKRVPVLLLHGCRVAP